MEKNVIEDFSHKTVKTCFLIRNFISEAQCIELIEKANLAGFRRANDKYPVSYRTNRRYWEDNFELSKQFNDYLLSKGFGSPSFQSILQNYCGLNERLRFCRYDEGEVFNNHLDGHFFKGNGIESKLTFLLYLNDEYVGGNTFFYSDRNKSKTLLSFKGSIGDLLIFDHDIWHEGSSIISGAKFVLRSDLLFDKQDLSDSHLGYIWSMSAVDDKLFTTGRDQSIKKWDQNINLSTEAQYHLASVLKIKTDKKHVYSIGRDGLLCKADHDLGLLFKCNTMHKTGLDIVILGDNVFSIGSDGILRLWNKQLKLVDEVKAHSGWGWCIHKIDNNLLVSSGEDGICKFWDPKLNLIKEVDIGLGCIRCINYSEGNLYLCSEDGIVARLALDSDQVTVTKKIHDGIIRDLKIYDGKIVTAGEDYKVVSSNLELTHQLDLHKGENFITCLEELGGQIYASGYEGNICKLKVP